MRIRDTILLQLILFLAFTIFFSSCSGKSNNDAVVKAMEQSLMNSNIAVDNSTSDNLHELTKKAAEPASMDRANVWLPKAKQVSDLTKEIVNYLEGLKQKNSISDEKSKDILTRVLKYKEDVLKVDSSIRYEFADDFLLFSNSFDSTAQKANEFWENLLKNPAFAILTIFQNNIKNIENRVIRFCNSKVGSFDGHGFFDYYSAIVGQSSKYVKAGEQIEITAGIGAFSKAAQPTITINGKIVETGYDGVVLHKIKAQKKPGTYTVPVTLSFLDKTTGKNTTNTVNVEYTVAKECDQ